MDQYILHITNPTAWAEAQTTNSYTADSLHSEGFIHCSTFAQVIGVVNQWFKGQSDLLLLIIDTKRLTHEVHYEDLYNHGDAFPHLYGPLNVDAVIDHVPLTPNAAGIFEFPEELMNYEYKK
ncbi:MAG: DUF952 domain-containing protein [Flammeovirgaceae bacterium]